MKKTVTKNTDIRTFCGQPLRQCDLQLLSQAGIPDSRTILMDKESTAKMLRISEIMKELAPMYTDDTRLLWIEVVRGTPEEWCSFEEARPSKKSSRTTEAE